MACPAAHPAPRLTTFALFAATAPGLAPITARELEELGIVPAGQTADGVSFSGDFATVMRSNLWLRTASRVLARAGTFRARTFAELERHAAALPWERFIGPGTRVSLRISARKCRLFHTGAIAERIARAAGAELAQAADGEADEPQLFVVRGVRDEWTVSANSSGPHLHRRGYRLETARAPLRETLAAAMLLASGWDRRSPLVDPFCGSGTIPIEAALLGAGMAPGARHEFSFTRWPGVPRAEWDALLAGARSAAADQPEPLVSGYDRDDGAVRAAQANAGRAGVESLTVFARQALSAFEPPADRGWLVCNPPYGVRVGDARDLRDLYARFGAVTRERCAGWTVAFLATDPVLERATRLDLRPVLRTTNGGLPVRLMLARL